MRAPRFGPCRCDVACRCSLAPLAETMPDRCTPECEWILAGMDSALPYRRERVLLAGLLPWTRFPRWKRSAGARFRSEPGSNAPHVDARPARTLQLTQHNVC